MQKPLDKQQHPGMQAGIPLNATVKEILASLGLEQYYETFQREGIHARNLADLTSDDLAELVRLNVTHACTHTHAETQFHGRTIVHTRRSEGIMHFCDVETRGRASPPNQQPSYSNTAGRQRGLHLRRPGKEERRRALKQPPRTT